MRNSTTLEEAHRSPLESQPSKAFIEAMRRAGSQGKLPPYLPEQWRGFVLGQRKRHSFHESAKE